MAKNKTIAIDIGHGSDTFPPSKGVYKDGVGYAEHSFNSKLAVALDERLKEIGFKTLMYQKPNTKDIPLRQRTDYYNAKKVDLVYSLHANYNGSSSVNGRCVFYWHTSKKSKKLAEIIASGIKKAGYSTHGNGLHAGVPGTWTNLHINRETDMPAVLVENGFMSGDKDFDLVFGDKQADYIKDMAEIHAEAIAEYFGVKTTSKPSSPAPKPKPKPKPKPGAYTGGSIVDYLSSIGVSSSYSNRAKLAKEYGINGYKGTAKQNTDLLNKMRKGAAPSKPKPKPQPSKTIAQMATEVIAGKHGSGHANRRKSLGVNAVTYEKVRAEVNKRAGLSTPKPKGKSISQMATEVIKGVHGNGHENRRKSLGISQAQYNKVRAEVNRRT